MRTYRRVNAFATGGLSLMLVTSMFPAAGAAAAMMQVQPAYATESEVALMGTQSVEQLRAAADQAKSEYQQSQAAANEAQATINREPSAFLRISVQTTLCRYCKIPILLLRNIR